MKQVSPFSLTLAFLVLFCSFSFWVGIASNSPQKQPQQKTKEKQDQANKRNLELTKETSKSVSTESAQARNTLGLQSVAVVVGVSKYKNLPGNAQLRFADADAQALRHFLVSPKGGFLPENVTLLINEEATWQEILHA